MTDPQSIFFDESGAPVVITEPQPEVALEDELLNAGVGIDDLGTVLVICERHIKAESMRLASEAVRQILLRLGDTAAAVALRHAIGTPDERSLREQAASVGVSHVAIVRAAKRARKKLGLPQAPLVE